ncbi:MAG: histidine phosphatase family protein [Bermanella sp.]
MEFKTLDLLRHGEPQGGNVFRGVTDHALTEQGWSQLLAATEADAAAQHWDVIITSPLSRCHDFAQKLAARLAVPLVVNADLREFNFGIWENQDMETVFKEDFERIKGLWDDPMNFAAPAGEALLDFEARVLRAWSECLQRAEHKPLIVCHGGVIRLLLKEVLGLPFNNINRLDVPYACRSRVQLVSQQPYDYRLLSHG